MSTLTAPAGPAKPFLTASAAAEILGVSRHAVARAAARGQIRTLSLPVRAKYATADVLRLAATPREPQ